MSFLRKITALPASDIVSAAKLNGDEAETKDMAWPLVTEKKATQLLDRLCLREKLVSPRKFNASGDLRAESLRVLIHQWEGSEKRKLSTLINKWDFPPSRNF